jgi:hypothetical protein
VCVRQGRALPINPENPIEASACPQTVRNYRAGELDAELQYAMDHLNK